MGRPRQCCKGSTHYTTRAYDSVGEIVWSADFNDTADSTHLGIVSCQVLNATNTFVGGTSARNAGGTYWTLKAFAIADGSLVWQRDVEGDAITNSTGYSRGATGGGIVEMVLDGSGNIVCMMGYNGSGYQAFVVISAAGAYVNCHTTPVGTCGGVTFTINQLGDYHIYGTAGQSSKSVSDWASPFAGAPTTNSIHPGWTENFSISCARRIGGRDYLGVRYSDTSGHVATRGKVQAAAPYATVDFDLDISISINGTTEVSDIDVDSIGNILTAGSYFNDTRFAAETARLYNSSGTLQWESPCAGRSVAFDSNGYVYSAGSLGGGSMATVQHRNANGQYRWGHIHASCPLASLVRQIDIPAGYGYGYGYGIPAVIRSGSKVPTGVAQLPSLQEETYVADSCYGYGYGGGTPPANVTCGECYYVSQFDGANWNWVLQSQQFTTTVCTPPTWNPIHGGTLELFAITGAAYYGPVAVPATGLPDVLVWKLLNPGTGVPYQGQNPTCNGTCNAPTFTPPTVFPWTNAPYDAFVALYGVPRFTGDQLIVDCT